MLARPWPIKILFLCHLIAPLVNATFSAWMSEISLMEFLQVKWQRDSFIELFAMFALLPLGGMVIFLCQRWSYYVYLMVMLGVFYFNFVKWQEYPHLFDIFYVVSFFVVNLLVVGYFLIPAVRSVYFNERLRWWESEPRYMVGLSGEVCLKETFYPCEIENISRGGARLHASQLAEEDSLEEILLRFTYEEETMTVAAKVRHQQGSKMSIEFQHSDESKEQIRRLIRQSFAQKFVNRNAAPPLIESFFQWIHTLLRTGEGIFPMAPEPPGKKKLKKARSKKTKR